MQLTDNHNKEMTNDAATSRLVTDPTNQYMYRYWNGTQWTNQVSSSGSTLNDPETMDPTAATTPPAPGSEAPSPPVAPTVQVTQKSASGFGAVIGGIVAIVLVVVLVNQSGDDSSTAPTQAPTPATTVAP